MVRSRYPIYTLTILINVPLIAISDCDKKVVFEPTSRSHSPLAHSPGRGASGGTLRLTGWRVYWQSGKADCWMISFLEKVAVRAGSFKPKGFFIGRINQDPVSFNVALA